MTPDRKGFTERDYFDLKFKTQEEAFARVERGMELFASELKQLKSDMANINRYKWAVRMLTTMCVAVLGTIGAVGLWALSVWDKVSNIWPHSA